MQQLNLFREIIVDNFAGGGGASTGIEMATGLSVDIAINHDPAAIAMHKVNHPDTEHYCESVWDVDPVKAVRGRKVGLAWFSPDCKHFSKAKGGKPVNKNIRGLAWIAVKWAIAVKPRVIMLENVEEFKTWGPLNEDGFPDLDKRGNTFKSFVKALESLGYQVEFKELRACDFGAPTIRKRFFMIARCDGKPITWPKPTHGDPNSLEVQAGKLNAWLASSEIIDWSIGAPSIFNRKKDLSPNTLRRIERGIQKFVIDNPTPFIVPGQQNQAAFLSSYYTETSKNEVRGLSLDGPLHTITAGGNRFALVTAFLTKYYGQGIGQDINEPIHTIPTKDRFGLVTVHSQEYKITDIGLRMLQPHELFKGQGFPSDYIIDRDYEGKAYPKSAQVARCGNSVPPPFADALVRANLPEMSVEDSRYKRAIAN
ncbi:DNA cytosine methyltransferase [Peribacillus frigoritolerans]|uniref:DNA cytosine methyltransferase n=1 Tax=Peribacillus frigoritolerans TaxID=450367 RepID=UPI00207A8508|nr:DNA cytosine methyltransferase [Peribacillus frigoritolerans]USK77687.1 DNA cytosine methyltransferase [Peribacillus frigoritolerans]